MTNIIKHNFSGKSLVELYKIYGEGTGGFYSFWWKNEPFANEHPPKGVYELNFEKKLTNLTYDEQKAKTPKGYDLGHPAIILEAVFMNPEKKFLWDWYARTDTRSSDGYLVFVGRADAEGAGVSRWGPEDASAGIGVIFSRGLFNLKSDNLLGRVETLEKEIEKLRKFLVF